MWYGINKFFKWLEKKTYKCTPGFFIEIPRLFHLPILFRRSPKERVSSLAMAQIHPSPNCTDFQLTNFML